MSALVQYEPFVDNTTKLFLEQTKNIYVNNPEGCDFTQWLQFYAFDVIGEITYSKRHGFVENNKDVDGIVAYLSWLFLYVAPVSFNELSIRVSFEIDISRSVKYRSSTDCCSKTPSTSSSPNGVLSTLLSLSRNLLTTAWRSACRI